MKVGVALIVVGLALGAVVVRAWRQEVARAEWLRYQAEWVEPEDLLPPPM